MKRFALIVASLLALTACASIPAVQTDHDPTVDFGRYQTYAWRAKPTGGTALTMQRIVTRIDEQLRAKGWRLVAADDADIALAAHEIGRASCREKCVSTCRSRWSPYH